MSSSNVNRFANDGTEFALIKQQDFSAAVVAAFRQNTLLYDNSPAVIAKKSITSGVSHRFLMIDQGVAPEEHNAGDELLGQQFEVDDGAITVDTPALVGHVDIGEDDLDLADFEVVRPKAEAIGKQIAIELDRRAFRMAILAARTAALTKGGLTIHNGGNRVERVAANVATAYPVSSTGAQNFRDDAATLARQMDEDNVPESGRYLFITPYIRQVLSKDTTIFSKDFGAGNPNINARAIGLLEGFQIMPTTNNMPSTNVVTGPTKYQGDFTPSGADGQPAALALCGAMDGSAGIGMVQHGPLVRRMFFDTRRRSLHMHAKMLCGFGTLHPWCAGEIAVPTS